MANFGEVTMVTVVIVVFLASQSFIADSFCAIVTAFMMWATMLPLGIYSGQILLQVTKLCSYPIVTNSYTTVVLY